MARVRLAAAIAIAAATIAACSGCSPEPLGGERPKTEIYVLVDLSKTWHDPLDAENEAVNLRLLQEVGEGIALASEQAAPPVLVQYRVIGLNSLNRAPVCNVTFMPMLVGQRRDPGRLTRIKDLREYLGVDCPRVMLAAPAEANTEISAAISSVADRAKPEGASRYLIVASDFREESSAVEPLPKNALAGTRILELYRPVREDRFTGGQMRARIDGWKASLEDFGAVVSTAPDSGFGRADVVDFLTRK